MNYLFKYIAIPILITAATTFGIQNYVPLNWIDYFQTPKLGTTLVTIQGSDTISGSRTTINNNFTALNSGKIENSTTTLPLITSLTGLTSASALATVGTITSGVWQGTALTVSKGGTGSTTLAGFHLLMGSSTNAVDTIAFGSSGQFLTSNGTGLAPSWTTSSLDQTLNYNWTGTTRIKNLNASSSVIFNGITLNYPSNQGASSTMLMNDGSGNMTWNSESWEFLGEFASTSVTAKLTANFSARRELKVYLYSLGLSAEDSITMIFNGDAGGNYGFRTFENYTNVYSNDSQTYFGLQKSNNASSTAYTLDIYNTTAQRKYVNGRGSSSSGSLSGLGYAISGVWNNTSAQIVQITFSTIAASNFNANSFIRVYGSK